MTTYAPGYRLTLYKPRSVDATESLPLTPASGAAVPFKVMTLPNPNLVPNPELTVNLTGWTANASATLTRDTATVHSAPGSAKVVTANLDASGVFILNGAAHWSVRPSAPYAMTVWVEGTGAVGKAMRFGIAWKDAAMVDISQAQTTTNLSAGWALYGTSGIAPANAAFAYLYIYTSGAIGIFTIYVDDLQFEQAAVATPYAGEFQPYMNLPDGRRGRLDVLARKLDQGQLTVRLLDPRTTPGGSNLARWVTQFLGDANGASQLLGLKAYLEETLDGGTTWASFFTGRVSSASLDSPVMLSLAIRDASSDLNYEVFSGRPSASATGAGEPYVLPIGCSIAYGTIPATTAMAGTFGSSGVLRTITLATGTTGLQRVDNIATSALIQGNVTAGQTRYLAQPGVRVRFTAGGVTNKEAELDSLEIAGSGAIGAAVSSIFKRVTKLYLRPVASASDPFYTSITTGTIADATACTFACIATIVNTANGEGQGGLIIGDVHPVQLWADLLDGYYSRLTVAGVPRRTFPRATSAFTTLIADTSFPKFRAPIPAPMKMQDFVERHILAPYGLGMYLNADGQVVPVDLRPPQASPTSTTITDADLVADTVPQWSTDREQAITVFRVKTYIDYAIEMSQFVALGGGAGTGGIGGTVANGFRSLPAIPTGRFTSQPNEIVFPDFGTGDLGERTLAVDALGLRAIDGEVMAGGGGGGGVLGNLQSRLEWIISQAQALALFFKAPFGTGPQFLTLECLRTSNTNGVEIGTWRLIDCDMVPGLTGNVRGEVRLMLCVEHSPGHGGLTRTLRFLDAGPNTVATAPTVGTPSQETSNTQNGITVTVTLNASSEAATLWVCPTDTGTGTRPGDTNAGWRAVVPVGQTSPIITATGTYTVRNLPANTRVWVRVRTEPIAGKKIASPYAYPAGTGYVATATISAPTGLASSSVSTKGATLTWTNGDATKQVVVRVVGNAAQAGADAATPVDFMVLPAGGTTYYLSGLDSGGPWWHCDVYHRDDYGGSSSVNNLAAFQATGTAPTAPTPGGLVITRNGTTSPVPPTAQNGIILLGSTGIEMQLLPAPTGMGLDLELYRAPDSGGAPGTYALLATVPANQVHGRAYTYRDTLPVTSAIYWYKCRHVGAGVSAGSYTNDQSATAGWLPPIMVNVDAGQPVAGVVQEIWLDPSTFAPVSDTTKYIRSGSKLQPGAINTESDGISGFWLAPNVVITGWTLYGKRTGATDLCVATLRWSDTAGSAATTIDSLTLASGGVGSISNTAVNYRAVTGRTLNVEIRLKGVTAVTDGELYAVKLTIIRDSYQQQ